MPPPKPTGAAVACDATPHRTPTPTLRERELLQRCDATPHRTPTPTLRERELLQRCEATPHRTPTPTLRERELLQRCEVLGSSVLRLQHTVAEREAQLAMAHEIMHHQMQPGPAAETAAAAAQPQLPQPPQLRRLSSPVDHTPVSQSPVQWRAPSPQLGVRATVTPAPPPERLSPPQSSPPTDGDLRQLQRPALLQPHPRPQSRAESVQSEVRGAVQNLVAETVQNLVADAERRHDSAAALYSLLRTHGTGSPSAPAHYPGAPHNGWESSDVAVSG